MFVQTWWCTTWIVVVTMPCGLIVFDCHRFVIVLLLLEFVLSGSTFLEHDQRELTISREKLMKKDRRHSIFDDKNRAVLGELVSLSNEIVMSVKSVLFLLLVLSIRIWVIMVIYLVRIWKLEQWELMKNFVQLFDVYKLLLQYPWLYVLLDDHPDSHHICVCGVFFSFKGKLDKATLDLIRRPRCGLADYDPNRLPRPHIYGNRRRRRYVLQGQKWAKTYLTYK